jgi:hypothetical protein
MTVLNFPASPGLNATYTENNVTYTWNGSYWDANNTGSLDNIYVEVAGDVMTGNLLLPGGGGDTAALQKQEIELLIDAAGGGGTGPTDLYWERDTGALSPKVSTDNVNIGDGKITLAAGGSATFAAGDFAWSAAGASLTRQTISNSTAGTTADILFRTGGAIRGAVGASTSNDFVIDYRTTNGLQFNNSGAKRAELSVDGDFSLGYAGGTTPTVELNANGSITAETRVNADQFFSIGSGKYAFSTRPSGAGAPVTSYIMQEGDAAFGIEPDGSINIELKKDGSSKFAGDMAIGTTGSFTPSTPAISLNAADGSGTFKGAVTAPYLLAQDKTFNTGSLRLARVQSYLNDIDNTRLNVNIDNTAGSESIVFKAEGYQSTGIKFVYDEPKTADFSGNITAAGISKIGPLQYDPDTDTDYSWTPQGNIRANTVNLMAKSNHQGFLSDAKPTVLTATMAIQVKYDGVEKFTVNRQGVVTGQNITFNLETDDPTKYTTEVDEEGNETQTYIGATLDVKESIETAVAARAAMRETFQELLVAVQSATDFGELKAAMLVALEDYAA